MIDHYSIYKPPATSIPKTQTVRVFGASKTARPANQRVRLRRYLLLSFSRLTVAQTLTEALANLRAAIKTDVADVALVDGGGRPAAGGAADHGPLANLQRVEYLFSPKLVFISPTFVY